MRVDRVPHFSRLISAALDAGFITLKYFLISRTRGLSKNVSEWLPLKRYYVAIISVGIVFLFIHILILCGCESEVQKVSLFCSVSSASSTVGIAINIFMVSTIFAYKRLSSIFVGISLSYRYTGSREHTFWEGFKIILAFLLVTFVGIIVLVTATGILGAGVLFDFSSSASTPSLLLPVTRVLAFTTVILLAGSVLGASVYCYYKMLWIILSTSSKLAKIKRTEHKDKVFAMHRKLYAMIIFSGVLSVLLVLDLLLNRNFISSY
jgi:hypothetical protein